MTVERGPWERALDEHLRRCVACLAGARQHDHDCIALGCELETKPWMCPEALDLFNPAVREFIRAARDPS
jgi:hypothetical protein